MNRISLRTGRLTAALRAAFAAGRRQCLSGLVIATMLWSLFPAHAVPPDDMYLRIYSGIEAADALAAKGQPDLALAKYREAQIALKDFQKANRDWNAKMVSYRAGYLAARIAALSEPPPKSVVPATSNASSTSAAPGSSDAARGVPASAKASSSATTSQVKVLSPGAEPRKVLRLQPKPGDKQTLTTSMKLNIDMAIPDMPSQIIKTPAMNMTSVVTVKDVSAGGDITYEMTVNDTSLADEPGVLPQVSGPIKSALDKLKGHSGTGTISDRGSSKGIELKASGEVEPQTRQIMDQLTGYFSMIAVPLPEEAVGIGAKWEAKVSIQSQGITADQITTYQVVSVDGERLVLKSTIAQHAANQKMQFPAMPGIKFDLTNMTGKGDGEATVNLGQLLPAQGTATLHSDFALAANIGGQPRTMAVKMDMSLKLEAK